MSERLYFCPYCRDAGWESIARVKFGRAYEAVTYCSCEAGVKLAAGYWRDRLSSDTGKRHFAALAGARPEMAARVSAYLDSNPDAPLRPSHEEAW